MTLKFTVHVVLRDIVISMKHSRDNQIIPPNVRFLPVTATISSCVLYISYNDSFLVLCLILLTVASWICA